MLYSRRNSTNYLDIVAAVAFAVSEWCPLKFKVPTQYIMSTFISDNNMGVAAIVVAAFVVIVTVAVAFIVIVAVAVAFVVIVAFVFAVAFILAVAVAVAFVLIVAVTVVAFAGVEIHVHLVVKN